MMRRLPIIMIALLLVGCKTHQQPVVTSTETVRVETRTEWRTDTVTITLEPQHAEAVTPLSRDTVSTLETDYATSYAEVTNGYLIHRLRGKHVERAVPVQVSTVYRDSVRSEVVRVPEPYEVKVEVPAELTWWQRARLASWWWLVGSTLALGVWSLRKPLLRLVSPLLTRLPNMF